MEYRATRGFPDDEKFGLTSQLHRAAISIASNIVEGAARSSLPEYVRFLEIAYGSAKEVEYQLSIAERLGYGQSVTIHALTDQASETAKVLHGLIRALRDKSLLRPFYLSPPA
ncbi:MAG: four helix bundle protein [Planctomycetes bacterium]|nr:four helix bundle protein [Planctomycetota bacterium]